MEIRLFSWLTQSDLPLTGQKEHKGEHVRFLTFSEKNS